MKHDKMKKQRANVVVPLTAVGRQQMRRAGRSGSEVAGQWGWGGITPRLLPLVKVDFHARCSYNFFEGEKKKKKESCTQSVLRFVGWPQTSQLCQSSCDPS